MPRSRRTDRSPSASPAAHCERSARHSTAPICSASSPKFARCAPRSTPRRPSFRTSLRALRRFSVIFLVERWAIHRSGRGRWAFQIISASATGGSAISSLICSPDADERVVTNRRVGEITISFGGDTYQAAQFARSVPDFVLKGRFADLVKLDLQALEQEMGFDVETTRRWWRRLIWGERRLVEFPRG